MTARGSLGRAAHPGVCRAGVALNSPRDVKRGQNGAMPRPPAPRRRPAWCERCAAATLPAPRTTDRFVSRLRHGCIGRGGASPQHPQRRRVDGVLLGSVSGQPGGRPSGREESHRWRLPKRVGLGAILTKPWQVAPRFPSVTNMRGATERREVDFGACSLTSARRSSAVRWAGDYLATPRRGSRVASRR